MDEDQAAEHSEAASNSPGEDKPLLSSAQGQEAQGLSANDNIEPDDPRTQPSGAYYQHIVESLRAMVENKFYIIVFVIATIFTLFADDCRILWMPKEADPYMHALMFATFVMFGWCAFLPHSYS